ncbi:MAG: hypothetical protein OXC11_09445, partial [Rhodospirillales bacterium]|nr:hypothetical protein [Rhodospirillales bacterium]
LDIEAVVCSGAAVGEGQSPLAKGAVGFRSVLFAQGRAILSGEHAETDTGKTTAGADSGERRMMGGPRFAEIASQT